MREVTELKDKDIVIVGGRRLAFGSVSGYSRHCGMEDDDIRDRVEESNKLGHNMVWLNAMPSVLSATPQCSTCNTPTEWPVKECSRCVGRVKRVKSGEIIIVSSNYSYERGYWRVEEPNWMSGDNWRLVRPEAVYEVWDSNRGNKSKASSLRLLLKDEIAASVGFMTQDNKTCHIHIVAHDPSEYSK
jgi:hypothetical protein